MRGRRAHGAGSSRRRPHQPDGLAQHLEVQPYAILERRVDGVGFLGGPAGLGGQLLHALGHGVPDQIDLAARTHRQLRGARLDLRQHVLQLGQRRPRRRGALLQLAGGCRAGLIDHLRRGLDQSAGFGQPGLKHLVGLLTRGERGFGQLVDLFARRGGVAGGRGAGLLGGGGQGLDRRPGLGLHLRPLVGRGHRDGLQRLQSGLAELLALGPGGFGQIAELLGGIGHQVAQALATLEGPVAEFLRRQPRLADELRELHRVGLGLFGEARMVSLQRLGQRGQRGALIGQPRLDGAHLVGDTDPCRLQAGNVAGQVFAGGPRGAAGFTRRRGDIGGATRQRDLGLAQLGLGQVGGLGHHSRLLGDAVGNPRGLGVQAPGQGVHFRTLASQRDGQLPGCPDGNVGAFHQPLALAGQRFTQGQQGLARRVGGVPGPDDLLAHALHHMAGPRRGGQGGGQHVLGHGLGPPRLGRQLLALSQHVGAAEDEHRRPHRQHREHRHGEGVVAQRRHAAAIADGKRDRGQRPEHGHRQGDQIDRPG